jgi:hypothetical protein
MAATYAIQTIQGACFANSALPTLRALTQPAHTGMTSRDMADHPIMNPSVLPAGSCPEHMPAPAATDNGKVAT